MKKRVLSIIICLCLAMTLLQTAALADGVLTAPNAKWQTAENGEWISGSFQDAVNEVYDGGSQRGISAQRSLIGVGSTANLTLKSGNLIMETGTELRNNNNTTENGVSLRFLQKLGLYLSLSFWL